MSSEPSPSDLRPPTSGLRIPSAVQRHRDRACAACPTPCALRDNHANPCDVCPLTPSTWPQWDCRPSEPSSGSRPPAPGSGLGDRLAAAIETHVLTPAEPYAPAIVAAVRKCSGCKADQRALNGGGLLPGEAPPAVV